MEQRHSTSSDDLPDVTEANALAHLYDALDRQPKSIAIHEMLIENWWYYDEGMKHAFLDQLPRQ